MNKKEYYKSQNGLEVWDVVNQFTKDLSGVEAFDTGNIIKYACRWKKKNGLEDLYKLKSYVEHLIEFEENTKKLDKLTIKKTSGRYPWGSEDVIDNLREKKKKTSGRYPWGSEDVIDNLREKKKKHEVKKHLLKSFEESTKKDDSKNNRVICDIEIYSEMSNIYYRYENGLIDNPVRRIIIRSPINLNDKQKKEILISNSIYELYEKIMSILDIPQQKEFVEQWNEWIEELNEFKEYWKFIY